MNPDNQNNLNQNQPAPQPSQKQPKGDENPQAANFVRDKISHLFEDGQNQTQPQTPPAQNLQNQAQNTQTPQVDSQPAQPTPQTPTSPSTQPQTPQVSPTMNTPQSHPQHADQPSAASQQAAQPNIVPPQPATQNQNQPTQSSPMHQPPQTPQSQSLNQQLQSSEKLSNEASAIHAASNNPSPSQPSQQNINQTTPSDVTNKTPTPAFEIPQTVQQNQQSQPPAQPVSQTNQTNTTPQEVQNEKTQPVLAPISPNNVDELIHPHRQEEGELLPPNVPKPKEEAPDTKTERKTPSRLKPIILSLIIGLFVYGTANSQVIMGRVYYFTAPGSASSNLEINPSGTLAVSKQNRIIIPKINVDVPVVYDETSFDEDRVQEALKRGAVHYGNTALPGEIGNNVIIGHSSNNWWSAAEYKFIFVLLDKLEKGDTFELHYKETRYVYKVTGKKVVEPDDTSVLASTDKPITTLITCTPPGTGWKRLIVVAEQISPEVNDNSKQIDNQAPDQLESTLPGNEPTAWEKIKDLF